jgi:hypothetical protein
VILFTGDIHGSHSIGKLGSHDFPAGRTLDADDCLVVCGDLGLVWDARESRFESHWLDWLSAKPWTTLFVDGNHENHDRLAAMPVGEWHGGRVHAVRPDVLHLMRGEVFDVGGETLLALGGAQTSDVDGRVEGRSWWASELPDAREREHAEDVLDGRGWEVDWVASHELPLRAVEGLYGGRDAWLAERPVSTDYPAWLQSVADRLDYRMWYAGHHHLDRALGDDVVETYDGIYLAGETEPWDPDLDEG